MGRNTSIKATAMLVAAAMAFSLAAFSPSESLATTNGKAQFWRGSIANLQLDDEGNPDWIQSGTWYVKISSASSSSSAEEGRPNVKFLAQMTMVQLDGTAAHKHRVSNLVLSNYTTTSNASLSLEGNATVTMRDGPVENVPVKVSVTGRSVAIWVGPEMIDGHFGDLPMYGTVSRVPSKMTAQSYSAPESPGPAPSASTSTSTSNSTSTTNSTFATSNNTAPAANNNNNSTSTITTTSPSNSTSSSTSSNSTSTSAAGNQSPPSSSSSSNNSASTSSNSTSSNSTSNTSSSSNSTQSSSPPPATSTTGSNSTTPAQPTGTTNSISLAARPALDLYSWFSGDSENPTLRVAANSDATIAITNETERKHKLIIQSQDGTQLAASQDVLVGQSGQLVFKPTSAGTLQYMCDYHSPMKGTIEVT